MKKFKFSLDTVLDYKNRVLDELKREHGIIIAKIMAKEAEIAALEAEYNRVKEDFNRGKRDGMSVSEALSFEEHIHVLQYNIKEEYKKLRALQREEEKKRAEVVAAKTEASSIDKLKEKRLEEYDTMVRKAEELFIEEFVMNQKATAVSG